MPIFQTTSYVFEDPESAAAYFNLQEYGNTYSRIMNPTVAVFEERVANLEGGCGAVAFASGIAAQAAALFTLLQPGDHVVSSAALYGGSVNQFKHLLRKMSVELTWVDPDDLDAWRQAVRPNTKAFFGETIGNPGGNVLDIETVASIAHEHDLPLIVDNTFATPYLCRPIEWGADIVIHSATKFIGGHGTSIGGVVVEAGTFNWSNGRFPVVADPSPAYHGLQFHETFGTYGYLMKLRAETLRDLGGALVAVQRVPVPARAGDAVAADGAPRRQRAAGGGVPGGARAGHERDLPRPAGQQVPAAGRQVPAARRRRGVLLRLRRRARGRAGPHPRRDALVPSGQRRRREEPDHPPRQHHPPPAERRRTAGGRRRSRDGAAVGRPRVGRRPDLGSGAGASPPWPRRREGGGSQMIDLEPYQDPLTIQRVLLRRADDRHRGSVEERAARQLLRRLLPQAARLSGDPGEPPRDGDPRRDELSEPVGDVPEPVDIVNVFRAPDALPGIAREAVAIGAGALWCQFGVINDEGARIATDGGVTVIMDRCLKVEHARYVGRMHWLGFNTQRITAVRGGLQ